MNKEYWANFYKSKHLLEPSSFAKLCRKYIPKGSLVLDLGCGNGRDSYYLSEKGSVVGIDYACEPECTDGAIFLKADINKIPFSRISYDIVYSRFFFHSVPSKIVDKILEVSTGVLMAEFRAKGDIPTYLPDHERNFIDGDSFLSKVLKKNFEIIYYEKAKGLSPFKNVDPLLIRIICRRKH